VEAGSTDRDTRATLALPPLGAGARRRAVSQGWRLEFLRPEDPDDRSMLIRLAHPELDDAVNDGLETVVVGGEELNPRLHFTIHEIVAAQILDDDPPEVFVTAQRLVAGGRDHHEVLHMLGYVLSGQLWGALHERREYDRAEHLKALAALPGSFDAAFSRRPNRAARRAEARLHRRH
jgi:hypothetical protein